MQPNADQSHDANDPTAAHCRVTVPEAARILSISPEAVRARIQRETLVREKALDGTVYIRLGTDQMRTNGDGVSDGASSRSRSNGINKTCAPFIRASGNFGSRKPTLGRSATYRTGESRSSSLTSSNT
jgi:hypothetical protein